MRSTFYRISTLFLLFILLSAFSVPNTMRGVDAVASEAMAEMMPFERAVDYWFEAIEGEKPQKDVFYRALSGYFQLREKGHFSDNNLITIIDFSLPSTAKRLWVIDLKEKITLFHEVVSHGRNSGLLFAEKFSNTPSSYMSSLGFYSTAEKYTGKHGLSMRLDGLQPGLNDKARERAIVVHGADYAKPEIADQTGRLGRSLGCPAVPPGITKDLIDTIADGSCFFIYAADANLKAFAAAAPPVVDRDVFGG